MNNDVPTTRIRATVRPRHLLFSIVLLLLLGIFFVNAKPPPFPTYDDCPGAAWRFDTEEAPWSDVTWKAGGDSPRAIQINITMRFTPGTQLDLPANITIDESPSATTFDIEPHFFNVANTVQHFDRVSGVLNLSLRMAVRTHNARESNARAAVHKEPVDVKFAGVCGRLMNISMRYGLQQAQVARFLTSVGGGGRSINSANYSFARDTCRSHGMTLPTILKNHEWNYWKNEVWAAATPRVDQWVGVFSVDRRPEYSQYCWQDDVDFDPALCTNANAANQYFAISRKAPSGSGWDCKSDVGCGVLNINGVSQGWETSTGTHNYSARYTNANWQFMNLPVQPGDVNPSRDPIFFYCQMMVTYKSTDIIFTSLTGPELYTYTHSATADESATVSLSRPTPSFGGGGTGSLSQTDPTLSDGNVSHSKRTPTIGSPTRPHTRSATVSQTGSEAETASAADISVTGATSSASSSRAATESAAASSSAAQSDTRSVDLTLSAPRSNTTEPTPTAPRSPTLDATETVDPTLSAPVTSTPDVTETVPLSAATPTRTFTVSSTRTISKPYFPPPLPTAAPPLPVAEQALLSTTAVLSASLAAPAASQTLRALSIIAVIDTEQRCKLLSLGLDKYASEDRQFPESFAPAIKVYSGSNATKDAYFGLPSRRGAILANCFLCPLVIFCATMLVGAVRKYVISKKVYGDASLFAAGRVPGMIAAAMGSLALDGIMASSVVITSVPSPDGGDIALAVFGVLIGVSYVVIPGVYLKWKFAKEEAEGRPVECVPAILIKPADKPGASKPAAGLLWLCFGDETQVGDMELTEAFRTIFATSRGPSRHWDREVLKQYPHSRWKQAWKTNKRLAAKWSFWLDATLLCIAAIGKGWATTRPCDANNKVQLLQFMVSVTAFFFAITVRPPISPMRRLADIFAGFLMTLSSFCLLMLGAETAMLVRRCSLAAAFLSTSSAIALFFFRRVVMIIMKWKIRPAPNTFSFSLNSRHSGDDGGGDGLVDLADFLLLPILGGGGSDNNNNKNNNDSSSSPRTNSNNYDDDDVEMQAAVAAAAASTSYSPPAGATGGGEAEIDLTEFFSSPTSPREAADVGEAEAAADGNSWPPISAYLQDALGGGGDTAAVAVDQGEVDPDVALIDVDLDEVLASLAEEEEEHHHQ